jgi:muramidase (phage lysozyme)
MPIITAQQAGGIEVVAMLDTIAWAEGTSTSPITKVDGYDVIVTSVLGATVFTDFSTHPMLGKQPLVIRRVPLLRSDAAGRYQLMARYFPIYKAQLKLPDFSPLSQDLIAIQQMKERKAYAALQAGDVEAAIARHLEPVALRSVIVEAWKRLRTRRENYGCGCVVLPTAPRRSH